MKVCENEEEQRLVEDEERAEEKRQLKRPAAEK